MIKFKKRNTIKEYYIKTHHVREFIKRDWVLTNHFLWDLFREWEIDEEVIEDELTKLLNKKNKLAGSELIDKND